VQSAVNADFLSSCLEERGGGTVDSPIKYPWQQLVVDAFLEFKPQPLRHKISIAERAISQRLRERPELEEQLALRDALIALDTLIPVKERVEESEERSVTWVTDLVVNSFHFLTSLPAERQLHALDSADGHAPRLARKRVCLSCAAFCGTSTRQEAEIQEHRKGVFSDAFIPLHYPTNATYGMPRSSWLTTSGLEIPLLI